MSRKRRRRISWFPIGKRARIVLAALVVPAVVLASWPAGPTSEGGPEDAAGNGDSSVLDRYLDAPYEPGLPDTVTARVRAAGALREAGDFTAATTAFEALAAEVPVFADWAYLLAADAAASGGDTAAVRAALARTDPELERDRGWRARVRGYREAKDPAGALAAAAAAAPEPAGERVDRLVTHGELALQLRDTATARTSLRLAADSFPASSRAVEAARRLDALAGTTLDDLRRIGRVYLQHRNFERALRGLDAYLDGRGGDADTRNALRLEIGRALFAAGQNGQAERRMLALAALQIAPGMKAEALLIAGRAQYRSGRLTAGAATLRRAADAAGDHGPHAAEALFVLGDLAHDAGRLDDARALYRRAASADPDAARGHEAAVRAGTLVYLGGRGDEAAQAFSEAAAGGGDARRQRLGYWAALASSLAGAAERADSALREVLDVDPLSYYGMRAQQRLGLGPPTLPPGPSRSEETDARVANALLRYDVLRAVGLNDAAAYELERVQRHHAPLGDLRYALAEALIERGDVLRGVLVGRAIEREQVSDLRLQRIIHPLPYRELIEREAQRNGLDPYFVAALIRQESLFNPQARSGAGAIGLMQVMPATGRAIAQRLGMSGFTPDDLTRPDVNLRIGTVMLAELLRRYDGRLVDVLVAYNAGSGRLARWRNLVEYRDPELFVERIPYDETRDYVRIVQRNAHVYRTIYAD